MYFLDNNSGISTMPPVAGTQSTTPRWFTESDGIQGVSWPGQDWFNIVQAELLNILQDSGIRPDKTKLNQLTLAINVIIGNKALLQKNHLSEIALAGTTAQQNARHALGLGDVATLDRLQNATLNQRGIVQLSSATDSDSETLAATPNAVRKAYDAATRLASINQVGQVQLCDEVVVGSVTLAATANAVKTAYTTATRLASTTRAGWVQLSDELGDYSTDRAATANALRQAYDQATRLASTTQVGQVQLYSGLDSISHNMAATAGAVKLAFDQAYDRATRSASTDQVGQVQLYDGVDSTSTTQAATANAVKKAYDKAKDAASPIGVPLPWPSTSIPSGWIKCEGQSFSVSSYPELALAYPNGKLPDLRGEFIRGWDDGRGIDSGRSLLSLQGDAIRNIVGTIGADDGTGGNVLTGAFFSSGWLSYDAGSRPEGNGFIAGFDASRVVPTANENRPRNIAFNYIVRAA